MTNTQRQAKKDWEQARTATDKARRELRDARYGSDEDRREASENHILASQYERDCYNEYRYSLQENI